MNMTRSIRIVIPGALILLAGSSGCSLLYDSECQAGDRCPDDGSSTDATGTTGETTTSVGPTTATMTTVTTDTTSVDSSDGEDTSTSTGQDIDCRLDAWVEGSECPANAPFCIDGMCTRCSKNDGEANSCSAQAGGLVCLDSGECVECLSGMDTDACGASTPICSSENECVACTSHDQCPGGAGCDLFAGTCLPPDAVFETDAAGIGASLNTIGPGGRGTIRVMDESYIGPGLNIPTGSTIAIIGFADDTSFVVNDGFPAFTINGGTTLYLERFAVSRVGANAFGINSQGDVWLDDSTVENFTRGINSTGGRVHLENTRMIQNSGAGVYSTGNQDITLLNVILAGNGTDSGLSNGFVATGSPMLEMVYVTIAQNTGDSSGAIDAPTATGTIRNSIIVSSNLSASISANEDLDITYSAVADDDFLGGEGVMPIASYGALMLDANWEIGAGSSAANIALRVEGDPSTDINGVARPNVGENDFAGADLPD